MPLWKKLLLRSFGFGAGFGLVLCFAIGIWAYYKSRPKPPKPWDTRSITAEFDSVRPSGDKNYLTFYYVLENNTDFDYRLESGTGIDVTVKLKKAKTFAQFGGLRDSLKFPVFVPARRRVRFPLTILYAYQVKEPEKSTPEERERYETEVRKYVTDELANLDGFVLFDSSSRYEVDFPNGWKQGK